MVETIEAKKPAILKESSIDATHNAELNHHPEHEHNKYTLIEVDKKYVSNFLCCIIIKGKHVLIKFALFIIIIIIRIIILF